MRRSARPATPAAISVNEDSANTTAVTLGMSGLTYGVGGGSDEVGPDADLQGHGHSQSCMTLWLADGTTQVTANTTLSLGATAGPEVQDGRQCRSAAAT